jgi:hypothetical protein
MSKIYCIHFVTAVRSTGPRSVAGGDVFKIIVVADNPQHALEVGRHPADSGLEVTELGTAKDPTPRIIVDELENSV